MDPSDLRYEWRAWGSALDDVCVRIREHGRPADVRTGAEIYIVSTGTSTVNAKLRDGDLDIKLLRTETDGFEKWEPLPRAAFPIAAATLQPMLFDRLGIQPHGVERAEYTEDQLIGELVTPHPRLAAIAVEKHREIFAIEGCVAEWATVTIDGDTTNTAAVESADLDALRDVRRLTGLDAFPNTSYPRALRQALAQDPRRRGITDG